MTQQKFQFSLVETSYFQVGKLLAPNALKPANLTQPKRALSLIHLPNLMLANLLCSEEKINKRKPKLWLCDLGTLTSQWHLVAWASWKKNYGFSNILDSLDSTKSHFYIKCSSKTMFLPVAANVPQMFIWLCISGVQPKMHQTSGKNELCRKLAWDHFPFGYKKFLFWSLCLYSLFLAETLHTFHLFQWKWQKLSKISRKNLVWEKNWWLITCQEGKC